MMSNSNQLRKHVSMYTDGSCLQNPGPGGYAAILTYGDHSKEIFGGSPSTTNNRMEITAVIAGLQALKEPCIVTVYSDSKYVVDAINKQWVTRWKANGWRTSSGPTANIELWETLLSLLNVHQVSFVWVKGHAGNAKNERCDILARSEAKKYS